MLLNRLFSNKDDRKNCIPEKNLCRLPLHCLADSSANPAGKVSNYIMQGKLNAKVHLDLLCTSLILSSVFLVI